MWGPQAILVDNACELLASIRPVESEAFLSSVLKASWEWWEKLGAELFSFLRDLDIPPLPQTHEAPNDVPQPSHKILNLLHQIPLTTHHPSVLVQFSVVDCINLGSASTYRISCPVHKGTGPHRNCMMASGLPLS